MTHLDRLDVVIPIKDRPTIGQCIATLKKSFSQVSSIEPGRILVCDGGSQDSNCLHQLAAARQIPEVSVLPLHHEGFNKGRLLNHGLQATTAPIVLISDADILWSKTALKQMIAVARNQTQKVCCVHTVEESVPSLSTPQMFRYTYRIASAQDGHLVEVYPAVVSQRHRPGCGLLCARRSLFFQVGGYCHSFERWGWEDQDFLIRAELMGYPSVERGSVIHLSHGDRLRNLPEGNSVWESRDRNIRICLDRLAKGHLKGDLKHHDKNEEKYPPVASKQPIQVRYVPMPTFYRH